MVVRALSGRASTGGTVAVCVVVTADVVEGMLFDAVRAILELLESALITDSEIISTNLFDGFAQCGFAVRWQSHA